MQQTQLPASQSNSPLWSYSESLILFETAPAATFLHRLPLHCSSNYHPCSGGHLLAEAATSPAPAATNSCTSNHLPAPAATSSYQFCTSSYQLLHQQSSSCTSRYQQLPDLHQQLPVLNQRPLSCTS